MKNSVLLLISLIILFSAAYSWTSWRRIKKTERPLQLYKILSLEHWAASSASDRLSLSPNDDAFIHLATHAQLDNIITKFWSTVPQFVVLTLNTALLPGRLKLEANNSGGNLYYHLYNGYIPVKSIIKVQTATPDFKRAHHTQKNI